MNDFSDLESQLKALRPAPLRQDFVDRVEQAMSDPAPVSAPPDKIIRPHQFRRVWLAGLGLAAAAALLLLVRVNFRAPEKTQSLAAASPVPTAIHTPQPITSLPNAFVPAGSTQVVFHQRDEGLLFAENSEQPMRRLRSMTQETLHWKNPATGASLSVSYPSEQVQLVPISAQ
jgi:hypothetical protein